MSPEPQPPANSASLSVVIPAYNEAARLPHTIAVLANFLGARRQTVEVLIVDDGSTDDTAAILQTHPPAVTEHVTWRMLRNPSNRGKGYSVRHGMIEARGARMLFTDADMAAPIEEMAKLEAALDRGADIAIGSRRPDLIGNRQSRLRENAGRAFNRLVRAGLGLGFRDTQCGFKLFTRAAARIVFPQQRIERWGFDPELLFLAHRASLRVEEVPVTWSHVAGAKIRLGRDSARMLIDIVRVRVNAWRGCYPASRDRADADSRERRPRATTGSERPSAPAQSRQKSSRS